MLAMLGPVVICSVPGTRFAPIHLPASRIPVTPPWPASVEAPADGNTTVQAPVSNDATTTAATTGRATAPLKDPHRAGGCHVANPRAARSAIAGAMGNRYW